MTLASRWGALVSVVALSGALAIGCAGDADARVSAGCQEEADYAASDEGLREWAREAGIPEEDVVRDENVAERITDPDPERRSLKARYWSSCLAEEGWECEPPFEVTFEPPDACESPTGSEFANPFLEDE